MRRPTASARQMATTSQQRAHTGRQRAAPGRSCILARRPGFPVARALEHDEEAPWPPPPAQLLKGAVPQDWRVFRARLVRQEQDERRDQQPRTAPRSPATPAQDPGPSAAGVAAPSSSPLPDVHNNTHQHQPPRQSNVTNRRGARGNQWPPRVRHKPLWSAPHHRQQQQQHWLQDEAGQSSASPASSQQPAGQAGDITQGLNKPPPRRDASAASNNNNNNSAAKRPSPPHLPFPSALSSFHLATSSDSALGAAPLSHRQDGTASSRPASSCYGSAPQHQADQVDATTPRHSTTWNAPVTVHGALPPSSSSSSSSLSGSVDHPGAGAAAGELLGAHVDGELWAHALAAPEVGSVLVARQDMEATTLGFFHRAVVLITSHDPVHGAVGLVLNKPSPLTVSELSTTSAVAGFQEVFGQQRLHLGGPVHLDHVTLLHPFMGLKGAVQVADGLYTGGLPDAVQLVQAGLAHASQFVLSLGMSGWAPKQLEREMEAGCWHCVAAAPELLLPRAANRRSAARTPAGGAPAAPSAAAPTSSSSPPQHQRPMTPRQAYALHQPNCRGVPPLQPPPQHPVQAMNESCLWWQLLQVADLA